VLSLTEVKQKLKLAHPHTWLTKFFLFNAKEIVVDNAVYRLSIFISVLKIIVLKVKSCSKS